MAAHHLYGAKSYSRLNTCHPLLQKVAEKALEYSPYDITIIHGWRGEELQNALQESGASTKRFPDSRHNKSDDVLLDDPLTVSDALDFGPWIDDDIPWHDSHIFAIVAGCFFAAAVFHGVKIRYGGDWDSDGSTKDQKLMDWGHIELVFDP